MLGPNPFVGLRSQDVMEQFWTIAETSAMHPQVLAQQAELAREFIAILSGNSELAPGPDDKRFRDADWSANSFCKMYLQGYLAWARGLDELVGKLGLDEKDTQRARFAVSLVTDAFAPSNMLWANPIALKRAVESGGHEPRPRSGEHDAGSIRQSGNAGPSRQGKFQVGKNLGTSPGAVIFRNPVLELIQYRPTTEQ